MNMGVRGDVGRGQHSHTVNGKNDHRETLFGDGPESPPKCSGQPSLVTAKNLGGKLCGLEGICTLPPSGICSSLIHGEC